MKKTIRDIVAENREAFKAATTPAELRQIAKAAGILDGTDSENRARWPHFVKALNAVCQRDYYVMREVMIEQREAELGAQVEYEVTLFSDAKARCERFAVCDEGGKVVWYGRFFDGEGSEQSAAELEAAKKAIWLAGKVKEAFGIPAIRLNLKVDAQWLCTLSGKAACLAVAARKNNIQLNMEWVPGEENPADKWTTASGFKKWSEVDLGSLANRIWGERTEPAHEPDTVEIVEPIIVEAVEPAEPVN